jgi:signal transduction histidine kinase
MASGNRQGHLLVWALSVVVSLLIIQRTIPAGDELPSVISIVYIILLLFGFTTSRTVLNERAQRKRVEHLLDDLQDAHTNLEISAQRELAAIEARNALARDIHDGLGHYLTVINVQLEKALAFRTREPEVAERAIRDAKRLTGEALRDVRSSTGALDTRGERFSLSQAMGDLATNMEHSLTVDMRIDGSEEGYTEQALTALFRVAQEGLTNVQKHAQATHVDVRLELGGQAAELDMRDDGRGFDAGSAVSTGGSACYGLQGLRERLELIGGSLTIESQPGAGTHLHALVPRRGLLGDVQASIPARIGA